MTRRAFRAEHAFDGEHVLPGGALVLVDGDTVVAVEPGTAPAPTGWEVVHTPGTTLLPGLVESHAHLCGDSGPRALDQLPELDDSALDAVVVTSLAQTLAGGVTTVRDLGDHRWAVADRHRGHDGGPRVLASGPPITTSQGHCWSMGGGAEGVDDLRRAVRERAERGADVVKVMSSGGAMTTSTDVLAAQYTREELLAVVEEAHGLGLAVTAHAHALRAVELALDVGVDGIEHCTCLGPGGLALTPALADRLAASRVAVCPTLGHPPDVVHPPQIVAMMQRTGLSVEGHVANAGVLHRAGVRILAGTDAGITPTKLHGAVARAVVELAGAGVGPADALASATSVSADACGVGHRVGRLRPGLAADLLVVDGDATTDVGALGTVRTVVVGGRVLVDGGQPVR